MAETPAPLTCMVTVGWSGSLDGISKLSLKVPIAVGANWTVTVQLFPADRVFPEQLSDAMLKGAASGFADAIVPIRRFPPPVFATVTVPVTDLPSLTVPKGICRSVAGDTESVTLILPSAAWDEPVPLTETVTDALAGSLLGMLKLSVKVPAATGAKAMVILQDADGAIVWFEQPSLVMEKGTASGSVEPTTPTESAAFPLFVTVTVWVAEEPAATVPNGTIKSFVGATESVTEMAGVGTVPPVPLTFMVTELFAGSLLGILKLSVKVPVEVGANATVIVQEAAGRMVLFEHVSFVMEKGAARGFEDPTAPTSRFAVPVFVTVTVWFAEEPTMMLPKGTERSVVGDTESVTVMAGVETDAPVPLTFIVTEAFAGSLLGMLKLSVKVPVAVGAKAIVTVQEADGAMV